MGSSTSTVMVQEAKMEFTFAAVFILMIVLLTQGLHGEEHHVTERSLAPRRLKLVSADVQARWSRFLGCRGLEPEDAVITCSHQRLEYLWGKGVDCTKKVPLWSQATFVGCPAGFRVLDDYQTITCKFPGIWDNDVFTCEETFEEESTPSSTTKAKEPAIATTSPPPDYIILPNVGVVKLVPVVQTYTMAVQDCKKDGALLLDVDTDETKECSDALFDSTDDTEDGSFDGIWVGVQFQNGTWKNQQGIDVNHLPGFEWREGHPQPGTTCAVYMYSEETHASFTDRCSDASTIKQPYICIKR